MTSGASARCPALLRLLRWAACAACGHNLPVLVACTAAQPAPGVAGQVDMAGR